MKLFRTPHGRRWHRLLIVSDYEPPSLACARVYMSDLWRSVDVRTWRQSKKLELCGKCFPVDCPWAPDPWER